MGLCPASCNDNTLIANPTTSCVPSVRRRTFSRFIFFNCGMTLPDPMPGSIKPLFDDGSIVSSSTLTFPNGLPDPTFEDIQYDECSTPVPEATGRLVDFEDNIAISYTSGSPATTNAYYNYIFWADKMRNRYNMSYGMVYCNGDVYIPKDADFVPYTATLNAFISYRKPGQAGGQWFEFIKGTLNFANDPFALIDNPVPDFNLNTEGIVL